MPYTSGNFSFTPNSFAPTPVTGTTIASGAATSTWSDIASGLSTCLLKDGSQTVTANIPFSNFRLTGLGAATARTDAIQFAQVQDGTPVYLTGVGGTNSITATAAASMSAYVTGQKFHFIPANTNTGATTLAINGISGAKDVYSGGAACVGGEVKQNVPCEVVYDGTRFNILANGSGFPNATTAGNILLDSGTVYSSVPMPFNFRNILINPDGGIYQRAVAATADDVYFADRWNMLTQTNTVTPSVLSAPEDGFPFGVRITQSQASAQRFGFEQIVEAANCKFLRGQNVVFVPRVRISNSQAIRYAILGWTGTADAVTSDVVNDWTSSTYTAGNFFLAANLSVLAVGAQTPSANTWTSLAALTVAAGSSFNNLIAFVWTEGTAAQNVTFDFDYCQLERGSIATAFDRRSYGSELMMCQRYYEINGNTTSGLNLIASSLITGRTSAIPQPFKVTKFASPSVSVSTSTSTRMTGTFGSNNVNSGAFCVTVVNANADGDDFGGTYTWTATAEL